MTKKSEGLGTIQINVYHNGYDVIEFGLGRRETAGRKWVFESLDSMLAFLKENMASPMGERDAKVKG